MLIKTIIFFLGFLLGMMGTSILFGAKLSDIEDELASLREEKRKLYDAVRRKQNKIDELEKSLRKRLRREGENK